MGSREPTPAFATAKLDLARIKPGEVFGRIYHQRFPDPLGYGKTPSRFSDPRRRIATNRFGVLYLGSSLRVCFLEAVLRDERDGVVGDYLMDERELDSRLYAEIEVATELKLLDLRNGHSIRMGIPTDVVRGSKQGLARRWSVAVHAHPEQVDGLIYPSRLNGETNLALYDRAILKLTSTRTTVLKRASGLAAALGEFEVALV
ncbi:RES family NAD+ phosphorylase [Caulobacter sp. KR2-114]|uniref:RES family NAD+ phosphorylase n=1 Tax=Caulobacter sp. KR2-114 TaxID=3400912 RepID=UPI003BFAEF85